MNCQQYILTEGSCNHPIEKNWYIVMSEGACYERTVSQWIIYKIFTAQSSILSILGSSLIIFMVLRRTRNDLPQSFQNRLLLPMSVFDIIGSIGLAFSSMPVPRGSDCTYGAIGNKATCITQGFMLTLHCVVPMYNTMLCVYYLLAVKYRVKDETFLKYEALMHIVSIGPAVSAAIIAAANNLFNNYSIFCWLAESNKYEVDLNNINDHEDRNNVLSGLYSTLMVFCGLTFFVIAFCMISIYAFVRERELKMKSYAFQRPVEDNGTSGNTTRRTSRLSRDVIDTKKQASLYVGSFILTYLFTIIIMGFDLVLQQKFPLPLWLLQGVFAPLQGFWNFFAFIRPRFNIISRDHSEKSMLQKLFLAVVLKPEPTRQRKRKRSGRTHVKHKLSNNDSTVENCDKFSLFAVLPHKIKKIFLSKRAALSGLSILEKADQPNAPTELQQAHFVPKEIHQNDEHDFYDEEEQSEQNDIDTAAPSDYREAILLSLLVADDILPKPLHRKGIKSKRRVSMIDKVSVEIDSRNTNSLQPFSTMDPLPDIETKMYLKGSGKKSSKERRHSCSVIDNILSQENENFAIDYESNL